MWPSKTKPNETETVGLFLFNELLLVEELAPWKSDISSSLSVLEIMKILPQKTFVHPGLKFLLSSTDNIWVTSELLDSLHYQMALSGRNKDIFSYQPTLGLLLQMKAEKKIKQQKNESHHKSPSSQKKNFALLSTTRHNLHIVVM